MAAAGLAAALDVVETYTVPAIEAAVAERVAQLAETVHTFGGLVLSPSGAARRAGVLSFTMPGHDPADVLAALNAEGVTATARPDSLRLSPHASTPVEAVDRVAAALAGVRGAR